jgi:hypothetical protein
MGELCSLCVYYYLFLMFVLPNVIGPDCGLHFCSYCDFYFRLCCVPLSFNLSCSLLLPFDSSFGFHLYPTPTCLGLEGLVIVVYLLNMIYLLCIMANYAYHLVSIWFRIEIEWNGSIPDFENGMALSAVWFKTIIIMWRAWGARGNVSARVWLFFGAEWFSIYEEYSLLGVASFDLVPNQTRCFLERSCSIPVDSPTKRYQRLSMHMEHFFSHNIFILWILLVISCPIQK